jgi:hypothetical protein
MSETVNDSVSKRDFNIPEEYENYTDVIDELVTKYAAMFTDNMSRFDGGDIMKLLALLGQTVSELKNVVEDLKNVKDDDRSALYGVLLGIIVEKSVLASPNLNDEQKQQVRDAFATGGFVQTILESIRNYYQSVLTDMDVNNDKKVTKYEYEEYIFKKNQKSCGCAGVESNRRAAQCSANCCFPILSGGDGAIELELELEEK